MTVINSHALLKAAPIVDMYNRKCQDHGVSYGLTEAGYDIRIKQEIEFIPGINEVVVSTVYPEKNEVRHVIEKGRFVIASTIEQFDMPPNLMGIVHDKSTWARRGLSVFNTVIESGWKGWLTLELVYHGNERLVIPAGSGIAQVIFHELKLPARYDGKYQHQADRPVAAIYQD